MASATSNISPSRSNLVHRRIAYPLLGLTKSSLPSITPTLVFMVLLFLINIFLRGWQIGTAPKVISHDEMYYAVEAQSLAVSGQDPTGTWRPWSLTSAHPLYAELPGTIMAPAAYIFDDPWWSAKATSILLGSLLPIILAGVTWHLFYKKEIMIMTAVLASFNPWFFQISRLGFDALFSLFFLFLGMWILFANKNWYRLAALIPWFLAFYQYQGLKVIFVPIIWLSLAYVWYRERNASQETKDSTLPFFRLPLIFMATTILLIFLSFWYKIDNQAAGSRRDDLLTLNTSSVTEMVNQQRLNSFPSPFKPYFSNKATMLSKKLLSNYLSSFDFQRLFVSGDAIKNPVSVWSFGIFYPIDLLFIIAGLASLFTLKQWRPQTVLLTSFLLISPLPQMINNKGIWIFLRSSFLFPILIIVAAVGCYRLWNTTFYKYLTRVVLIGAWAFFVAWFGYDYFYQYPVYSTQTKEYGEYVLSEYITRLPKDKKILILADESRFVFESLIFFNQYITADSIQEIQDAYLDRGSFSYQNITVQTGCIPQQELDNGTIIIADTSTAYCSDEPKIEPLIEGQKEKLEITIKRPADNGILFNVHNDPLCQNFNVTQVAKFPKEDYKSLDQKQFCLLVMSIK